MNVYQYTYALYLISCFASGAVQASAYEALTHDAKRAIFSRIAGRRPLSLVLPDIATLRQVHRESRDLLSDRILLKEILADASLDSQSIIEHLASMEGPYYGIFNIGIKREGLAVRPFMTDAHGTRILPEIEAFVSQPYTQEERQTLLDCCIARLTQESLPAEEQSFVALIMRHIRCKGNLFQALLVNLEKDYTFTLVNLNQDQRTGFFSFRRPEEGPVHRFKRLKLMLPFYYDLCACGYVPLSLPGLISIQITACVDVCTNISEKNELRAICSRLAAIDFEPKSRQMYHDYCAELSPEETKRMKLFEK